MNALTVWAWVTAVITLSFASLSILALLFVPDAPWDRRETWFMLALSVLLGVPAWAWVLTGGA